MPLTPRRAASVVLASFLLAACTTDAPVGPPRAPSALIESGWTGYAGLVGCTMPATGGTCRFDGDSTVTAIAPTLYLDSVVGSPYWFHTTAPTRRFSWYQQASSPVPSTGPITLQFTPGARAVRVDLRILPYTLDAALTVDLPSAARIVAEELGGNVVTFDIPVTVAQCQSWVNTCQSSRTLSSTEGFRRITVEQATPYHVGFRFTVSAASVPVPTAALTVTCENVTRPGNPVTRGDEVECRVPATSRVTAWRFLPDDARFVPVLDSTTTGSWRGRIVAPGVVRAYGWATVAQVGVAPRDSAAAALVVAPRQWAAFTFAGPVDGGQGPLPNPPLRLGDLGVQTFDTTLNARYAARVRIESSGPNFGFAWVDSQLPRREMRVYVNNGALDTASAWWKSQRAGTYTAVDAATGRRLLYRYCGQAGRWFMPLDSLVQQIRWHEGIDVPPAPFVSHVQVVQRTIARHDLNAMAELVMAQFRPSQPTILPRQVVFDSLTANLQRWIAAADSLHQSQVHQAPTNAYRPVCAYRF